jgi:hypothetical protein
MFVAPQTKWLAATLQMYTSESVPDYDSTVLRESNARARGGVSH